MPPKLRGSLAQSLSHAGDTKPTPFYYCPSCAICRRTLTTSTRRHNIHALFLLSSRDQKQRIAAQPQSQQWRNRFFSSPSATTSTPSARHVPPRLRKLYEALAQFQDVATEQVNLSRLQLALKGLEVEEPLVRVAVLGLNDDVTAARKLVRLLLADPLKPQEDWEDILDSYGADAARGLLIRYGEVSEAVPNNLLPTISVPSSILKRGNLEILITSLGAGDFLGSAQPTADTFLVPTVTIQTSHTGRHNVVRYPVHRSIVCATGVDGLLSYSGLIARSDLKREADSIYGAVELAIPQPTGNGNGQKLSFVDTDKAEEALAKFRESVQNASLYERGWNTSGIQPVMKWLSASQARQGSLDLSMRTLVTSLIDAADDAAADQMSKVKQVEAESVPDRVRKDLDRTVSVWAERGHTELRGALEEGFASTRWRGLAWWKLFWRVDDVGMITSEILEKKFLRRAENEVIWTTGRFQQAGLLDKPIQNTPSTAPVPVVEGESSTKSIITPAPESQNKQEEAVTPWPTQIPASRARLLENTVPSLQAMAQRLVLFSLSTATLTSALSALTYISLPTATVYETCTMAAVGLVYSLRRQQRKWESARAFWEEEVREDGRTALRETEQQLRTVVHQGGRVVPNLSASKVRAAIITQARQALKETK